jgi:aspartyl-tRNA(Asn)/glutamyl-tRNA(Gln) amidotransferase subunit A
VHDVEPTDLVSMSAHELLRGYAAAQFTPEEVLEAVQRRMDEQEPILNAFYVREHELASMQAKASSERWRTGPASPGGAFGRGVIDGVPITCKENIATLGTPCPAGSAAYADAGPAHTDAPVATLVSAAGGVRLGKTVMPDLGMLSSGVSSLHGVCRSPWNPKWTPGGSSAGAGAAGAARLGPLHIGSDIGGSVRLPAGWTGLASLKPSFGTVPVDPPYQGRAIGPLARSVDDVALLMQVLAREDPLHRDYTYLHRPEQPWAIVWQQPLTDAGVKQLRVGVHTDAGSGMATDPEVVAVVDRVAELFAEAGAAVEQVQPFFSPDLLAQLDTFWRARAWQVLEALPESSRAMVLRYLVDWAATAAELSGSAVIEAHHAVQDIRRVTLAATHGFDVVLSPVAPVAAFPAEWHGPTNDPGTAMAHIAYTAPYNFSEQPAATVNAGSTGDGRPIGVQFAGRRFGDVALLRVCRWYESARPDDARPRWPA